jgi:hypothetical protein
MLPNSLRSTVPERIHEQLTKKGNKVSGGLGAVDPNITYLYLMATG